jgi:beta-lactamase regulating signal transducer with metallopeptidase domain
METINWYLLTFLLNALWQIPVIAGGAALAARLLRHGPANHRHVVWVAALIASVALPVVSTSTVTSQRTTSIAFTVPAPPRQGEPSPSRNAKPKASSQGPLSRTIAHRQTTATTVALAYFLLLSFCFARLLRALIRTALIRRSGTVAIQSPVMRQVWSRCAAAFRLSDVQLLTSARILTPAAAGFWRKVIILPETLLPSANEEELTAAIGHEMAHLARHDFALNVLYQLLYLPVSFNPASWVILRSIEETREMACDEFVTNRVLDPDVYARSLVRFAAAALNAGRKPSYLLGVFDGNILERRVQRLLHRPEVNLTRARLRLAASVAVLVLGSMVTSGIALKAYAQNSADLAPKLKALAPLMQQWHESGDPQLLHQAEQQLIEILAMDPANQQGLNGMLNLALWTNKPREAREWARKIVATYTKEKTAYYSLAVADWAVAVPAIISARNAAGLRPDAPPFLPDSATRASLRDQYGPTVDEGIRMLGSALKIDPNYSDAMAYMNLLYRLKALMAENMAGSTANVKEAEEWFKKSLAAKPGDDHDSSPLAPPLPPPPPPPPSPPAPPNQ